MTTTLTFNASQGAAFLVFGGATFAQTSIAQTNYVNTTTLTSLGGFNTYGNKTQLTAVKCQLTMRTISSFAFAGCTALISISGSALTSIGESAFQGTKFTSITFGTVTTLATSVFQSCPSLSSVNFANVVNVGSNAFSGCSVLSSVTCPKLVTIGDGAFSGTNISSIILSSSLTSIGASAFSSTALTNLIIPNSVTTIDNDAFLGATPFNWVDNSSATLTLGTTVFPASFNNASKTLYTSSSLNPIYSYVHTNDPLTTIVIGPSCYHEDTHILTDNGYIQIKNIEVGTNIKTLNDGYKKVIKTHFQPFRSANNSFTTKMCKQTLNNEFGEVWMTGGHCTLLDEYPEFMDEYAKNNKDEWMIDGKYIAFVGLNKQFQEMEEKCYFVNHIVLENDDVKRRYAIYANGILSESMSEHYYDAIRNHK